MADRNLLDPSMRSKAPFAPVGAQVLNATVNVAAINTALNSKKRKYYKVAEALKGTKKTPTQANLENEGREAFYPPALISPLLP